MNTATLTEKVNRWLHEHLAMKTPAKLLGGLALGALVIAASALPFGTAYADDPARPLSIEELGRLAALDEAQETELDGMSRKFNGIAFATRPLSIEELGRLAALDEAQETELDGMSREFNGIAFATRPLSIEDLSLLAALDEAQEMDLDQMSLKFVGIASS
jgi:hypothetical protein